jgi:hypothetical protein
MKMDKKLRNYLGIVIILFSCAVINITCNAKKEEKVIAEYTVIPKDNFIVYGIDVNRFIELKFLDIEKELSSETRVDSAVMVVYLDKSNDFVQKIKKTEIKDIITFTYGPIEDLTIYERYQDISPKTIRFYAGLLPTEDSTNKESVIRELQKNLPDNDTTRQIVAQIRKTFILGDYQDKLILIVNFDMPKFRIAEFVIGFAYGKMFYKYTFSTTEMLYP